LLHPGQMGASVGAALAERGVTVLWASQERSEATAARAMAAGLTDAGDLTAVTARADILLTICPPHAALDVAVAVAAQGFTGLYVDANAVAPATATTISDIVGQNGARFVDGDLIGGPMVPGASTRLYLSGPAAPSVARLFGGSDRGEAVVLGDDPTAASALKMTYAAWTKGTAALLLAVEAAAKASGVEDQLFAEWRRSQPDLPDRLAAAHRSLPKAWRWSGEMDEIARCFVDLGVTDGFARGAAEVFRAVGRDTV
jgi:3-hydroxyisobutyrate dehydrogenase-like beta-hydroxyacid dehydrogenase